MASLLRRALLGLGILLLMLSWTDAGPAATCGSQAGCVTFQIDSLSTGVCGNMCQFRACMYLNISAEFCTKPDTDTFSHACNRSTDVCRNETNRNYQLDTDKVQNVSTGLITCQTGAPGANLYFLLKDGRGCGKNSTRQPYPHLASTDNATVYCESNVNAVVSSCSGNGNGEGEVYECAWTVTLPTADNCVEGCQEWNEWTSCQDNQMNRTCKSDECLVEFAPCAEECSPENPICKYDKDRSQCTRSTNCGGEHEDVVCNCDEAGNGNACKTDWTMWGCNTTLGRYQRECVTVRGSRTETTYENSEVLCAASSTGYSTCSSDLDCPWDQKCSNGACVACDKYLKAKNGFNGCCLDTWRCAASSCTTMGFDNSARANIPQKKQNDTGVVCPPQVDYGARAPHYFSYASCSDGASAECEKYRGELCLYDGVSGNFKVCTQGCLKGNWGDWSECKNVTAEGSSCQTCLRERKCNNRPQLKESEPCTCSGGDGGDGGSSSTTIFIPPSCAIGSLPLQAQATGSDAAVTVSWYLNPSNVVPIWLTSSCIVNRTTASDAFSTEIFGTSDCQGLPSCQYSVTLTQGDLHFGTAVEINFDVNCTIKTADGKAVTYCLDSFTVSDGTDPECEGYAFGDDVLTLSSGSLKKVFEDPDSDTTTLSWNITATDNAAVKSVGCILTIEGQDYAIDYLQPALGSLYQFHYDAIPEGTSYLTCTVMDYASHAVNCSAEILTVKRCNPPQDYPVLAGQFCDYGKLWMYSFRDQADERWLVLTLEPKETNCTVTEVHFQLSNVWPFKPIPGQFDFKYNISDGDNLTFVVQLSKVLPSGSMTSLACAAGTYSTILVAFHAVMSCDTCGTQTAWAMERKNWRGFDSANWATYFPYGLDCSCSDAGMCVTSQVVPGTECKKSCKTAAVAWHANNYSDTCHPSLETCTASGCSLCDAIDSPFQLNFSSSARAVAIVRWDAQVQKFLVLIQPSAVGWNVKDGSSVTIGNSTQYFQGKKNKVEFLGSSVVASCQSVFYASVSFNIKLTSGSGKTAIEAVQQSPATTKLQPLPPASCSCAYNCKCDGLELELGLAACCDMTQGWGVAAPTSSSSTAANGAAQDSTSNSGGGVWIAVGTVVGLVGAAVAAAGGWWAGKKHTAAKETTFNIAPDPNRESGAGIFGTPHASQLVTPKVNALASFLSPASVPRYATLDGTQGASLA